MNLRKIKESDLKACAELYALVFSSAPWSEAWNQENSLDRIEHIFQSKGFVGILAYENEVLGFAIGTSEPFYYGSAFYLRDMCTRPNKQGKGIGKRILQYLEDELISRCVKNIYLTTERNIPAAKLYERSGYQYLKNNGFFSKTLKSQPNKLTIYVVFSSQASA